MVSRAVNTIGQAVAALVMVHEEVDQLLAVATAAEVAEEAERRLLLLGKRPYWPVGADDGPWAALAAVPGLFVMRAPIAEYGRYYDDMRAIVLRTDMPPDVESVTLWHELVHAERRHDARTLTPEEHAEVDREAARRMAATA